MTWQLCLRQMLTSRLWRALTQYFPLNGKICREGGNSGVTSDRIVSGHGPTRMPESPQGLRSPIRPSSLPSRKYRKVAELRREWVVGATGPPGPSRSGASNDHPASCCSFCDWKLDRACYVAVPVMTDGSEGPPLELRGLFEQFVPETR